MKFIYALNEIDRQELLLNGYKEIAKCTLNGDEVYCFDNANYEYATFSEDKNCEKFLITDVALFI